MLWNVEILINQISYVKKKILSLLLHNLLEVMDFKSRGKLFQSLQPYILYI